MLDLTQHNICIYCLISIKFDGLYLCISQDNSLIVGGGDNNIHIMDMETGIFKVS